jgi:YD repeat-containing protein
MAFGLTLASVVVAQSMSFRYFYDPAGQLYRVLDSTGTLLEYVYDPSGNILQILRSSVVPTSLGLLNFQPRVGFSGDTLVIEGQNFSTTPGNNLVTIGGVSATVLSATSTTLVVQIPPGASGQVIVTVGGNTASSGPTLLFMLSAAPTISSVSPGYGLAGQALTGLVVQGANMSGAGVEIPGGAMITSTTTSATQATLNLTVADTAGVYDVVATNAAGVSPTNAAAQFTVLPGTGDVEFQISVQNLLAAEASPVPTNTSAPTASIPAANRLEPPSLVAPNDDETVFTGQTVRFTLAQARGPVEFSVNGALFETLVEPPFEFLLTVPAGIEEVEVRVNADNGSFARRLHVAPDPGVIVRGHANVKAEVKLNAAGLQAEYFDFQTPLTALPDLNGLTPDRTGFVSALNIVNPRQVFGRDPFGLGFAPDYAARFSGYILIDSAGEHRFFLRSHAGSRLTIDGRLVVDVPAGTAEIEEGSGVLALDAGWHEIEVKHYETVGSPQLQLLWQRPGHRRETVAPEYMSTGDAWSAFTNERGDFVVSGVPAALDLVYGRAAKSGAGIPITRTQR